MSEPSDQRGGPQGWFEPELQQARLRGQIDLIQQALGPENVGVDLGPDDLLGDFRYLYRRGTILVRDEDLDRVRGQVEGAGEAQANRVTGLTRLQVADTTTALNTVDAALGVGVATPDHVLYVTPAGCCPATEPEETSARTPDPPVSTDDCDGSDVRVSVVDTGWLAGADTEHDWLCGVDGDPEMFDPHAIRPYVGHGAFVAGVVRTMAPESVVRVEGFLPQGGAVFEFDIVEQLDQALDWGPDIISLSAGTNSRNHADLIGFEVFWQSRLRHVKGTVLVAAAGNDGNEGPFWPAAFDWAVGVGALGRDGRRAWFSNYGDWVKVFALGEGLLNAYPTGDFTCHEVPNVGQVRHFTGMCRWSGTSFSTPLVSGLIAARMSATGEDARTAADVLMSLAREHGEPGVGPILRPGMGCPPKEEAR